MPLTEEAAPCPRCLGKGVPHFERMLRLDESVIRFLTVVDNPVGMPPENAHAAAVPEDVLTAVETDDKED